MHTKSQAAGALPALPELRLQIVDRNFAFRECNYSLYPSWLAYPWANSHLVIRGTHPYSLDRCDRTVLRDDVTGTLSPLETSTQYSEGLDASAVAAALHEFARSTPRPAKALLDLNTTAETQRVTGQLTVLGCRIASVNRMGELSTLGGLEFIPELHAAAGGPARTNGLRVRHRILIRPGTRVQFALPQALAEAALKRPRPGRNIEQIVILPSVFTDSSTFRTLWPEGPEPHLGYQYRLEFSQTENSVRVSPSPIAKESLSSIESPE